MHVVDPVRFFIFLIIISVFASPVCTGWIECDEYSAEWRKEYFDEKCP